MSGLEGFFIGLLVVTTGSIAWFASYVVYRLLKGHN